MRLFIAIDVPDQVKQTLLDLRHPEMGMRWTSPETVHLTLRFVGDVEPQTKEQLKAELEGIRARAFNMTLKGVGYFPPGKHPKVVWAGIKENRILTDLQSDIETACRKVGLDPEMRSFKPHITIGRVNGASKNEVLSYINQYKQLQIEEIHVDEFILYESKLHPDGAVHTPLHRFPLEDDSSHK